jgi:hypothetical protein
LVSSHSYNQWLENHFAVICFYGSICGLWLIGIFFICNVKGFV